MKKKDVFRECTTRREFLIGTTGIALTTVLPSCSHPSKTTVPERMKEPAIATVTNQELAGRCAWIGRNEHKTAYALFKKAVEATTDFAWLSNNDRVLIKISLNSGKSYPATTDPWAVHCMVKLLKEKGAGQILVGDQGHWNVIDVDLIFLDEEHQKIHGALEDIGDLYLVNLLVHGIYLRALRRFYSN